MMTNIYLPVAHVGLFTGVGPSMRLQVRGLGVGLAAVAVFTRVDDHLNIYLVNCKNFS